MYCKYSREAMEMCCILSGKYEINLCWNIDDLMKKCRYFSEVNRDEWIRIKNMNISDDDFIRMQGL